MAKKAAKKAKAKLSLEGIAIKPLKAHTPLFGMAAPAPGPQACTLTTLPAVHACLHTAISARYGKAVSDTTDLRSPAGLGLDDLAIRTDLYATVVLAVHFAGCRLRFLSPSHLVACKKVGEICALVWADLTHA
jgi:hypothetical protein